MTLTTMTQLHVSRRALNDMKYKCHAVMKGISIYADDGDHSAGSKGIVLVERSMC
jgi:hypothetical protein